MENKKARKYCVSLIGFCDCKLNKKITLNFFKNNSNYFKIFYSSSRWVRIPN